MKTLTLLVVLSFLFSIQAPARSVEISASQFVKKGIPYCTNKITRGCVKPQQGNTSKYYFAPKYKEKKTVAKLKTRLKSKAQAKSKVKTKKVAKNSTSNYHKTKQGKRDIASLLVEKLKNHKKKKSKNK